MSVGSGFRQKCRVPKSGSKAKQVAYTAGVPPTESRSKSVFLIISSSPLRDHTPFEARRTAERRISEPSVSPPKSAESAVPMVREVDFCGTRIFPLIPCVHTLSARSVGVVAKRAAFSAPTEVPEITLILSVIPLSESRFQTPIWYAPLPPPPARTNPIFLFIGKS